MQSKYRLEEHKLSDAVANVANNQAPDDIAMVSDAPSSIELLIFVDPLLVCDPDFDIRVSEKLYTVQSELFTQFSSMFKDFAQQLESKLSKIDEKFSQLGPSTVAVSDPVPVSHDFLHDSPGCV